MQKIIHGNKTLEALKNGATIMFNRITTVNANRIYKYNDGKILYSDSLGYSWEESWNQLVDFRWDEFIVVE